MRLIVDDREPPLLVTALTAQVDVPVERRRLEIGDFWVMGDHTDVPLAVVERKAWADLRASCVDGRFRSQRARLLSMFPPELRMPPLETPLCVLLVESEAHDWARTSEDWNHEQFGPLNHRAESEMLRATVVHADMRLIRTHGPEHTCRAVLWLCKELGRDAAIGRLESVPDLEVCNRAKKARKAAKKGATEDAALDRRAALLSLRGMSLPRVTAVEAAGRSLHDWAREYSEKPEEAVKALAAVPVRDKKLGGVLARRVLRMLTY